MDLSARTLPSCTFVFSPLEFDFEAELRRLDAAAFATLVRPPGSEPGSGRAGRPQEPPSKNTRRRRNGSETDRAMTLKLTESTRPQLLSSLAASAWPVSVGCIGLPPNLPNTTACACVHTASSRQARSCALWCGTSRCEFQRLLWDSVG